MSKKILFGFLGIVISLSLIGCTADLIPFNPKADIDIVGFCKTDPSGNLIVMVKNQGRKGAPATVTRVEFLPGGFVNVNTPPISAGATVELSPIDIPGVCFDSDCEFTIIVDVNNQADESSEGNNIANGRCIG